MPENATPGDAQDELAALLGEPTAAAMVKAAARARQHPLAEPDEMVATILLAALHGLDGSELRSALDVEELDRLADVVAVHIGATFARRLNDAFHHGYRQGIATIAFPSDQWLLWSLPHASWWRGNGGGYTPSLDQAGRYTRQGALQHTRKSWDYDVDAPSTVMVPAPSLQALGCQEVGELMTLRIMTAIDIATQHHRSVGEQEGGAGAGQ